MSPVTASKKTTTTKLDDLVLRDRSMALETARKSAPRRPSPVGVGQLTLVEHALCPLDARTSLRANLVHETTYQFTDDARRRRQAQVRVLCPLGLSAQDEFFLWGLLALTFQSVRPETEFHATPHYCLRHLGLIDAGSRRGGRQYQRFQEAIERLSAVRYCCDRFYDPVRAEHRKVSFGLLSYSLPLDSNSNRAWRICWDALFFEFAQAKGGALCFDLELYRRLSPAARRLLLFVSKVFARCLTTPKLMLEQLSVDVLGLAESLPVKHQLAKLRHACAELARHRVFPAEEPATIRKLRPGRYDVVLHRGTYFSRQSRTRKPLNDSPLVELLRTIGVDDRAIGSIFREFPEQAVREWADITLAAQERFGNSFFKRSPAAYFFDNLKKSVVDARTPPDWWHDVRKAEQQAQARRDRRRRQLHTPTKTPDASLSRAQDVLAALDLKLE